MHDAGHIYKNNDAIRLNEIEQGKIFLIHSPQKTEAWIAPQNPEDMLLILLF
jgi:hypothetical protein